MVERARERLQTALAERQEVVNIDLPGHGGTETFSRINGGMGPGVMRAEYGFAPSQLGLLTQDSGGFRLDGRKVIQPGLVDEQAEHMRRAATSALPKAQLAITFADTDLRDSEGNVLLAEVDRFNRAIQHPHSVQVNEIARYLHLADGLASSPIAPAVTALMISGQGGFQKLVEDPRLFGGMTKVLKEVNRVLKDLQAVRKEWYMGEVKGDIDRERVKDLLADLVTGSFALADGTTGGTRFSVDDLNGLSRAAVEIDRSGVLQDKMEGLVEGLDRVLENAEEVIADTARTAAVPGESTPLSGHILIGVDGSYDVIGSGNMRELQLQLEECISAADLSLFNNLYQLAHTPGVLADGVPTQAMDRNALYFISATRMLFDLFDAINAATEQQLQQFRGVADGKRKARPFIQRMHMQKGLVMGMIFNHLFLLLRTESQNTDAKLAEAFTTDVSGRQHTFVDDSIKVNQLTTGMLGKTTRIAHTYRAMRGMITAVRALFDKRAQAVRHRKK